LRITGQTVNSAGLEQQGLGPQSNPIKSSPKGALNTQVLQTNNNISLSNSSDKYSMFVSFRKFKAENLAHT
jgi:hypothetical protein